jgi:hypothetical protein
MLTSEQLTITELGPRTVQSPIVLSRTKGDGFADYVDDASGVLAHIEEGPDATPSVGLKFEKAGPRGHCYLRRS